MLLVGQPGELEQATRTLEGHGYIVTGTSTPHGAIDLAGSSDFDALVVGGGLSRTDGGYVTSHVRDRHPEIVVVVAQTLISIPTQLRQAFRARESEKADEAL